jgi:MOSC domain-containing protein
MGETRETAAVPTGQGDTIGRIGALWRYPVKSMLGESVGPTAVDDRGLDGDRGFGVIDTRTGMVASAKRPHRWRNLLRLRSETVGPGVIRIHFPDGHSVLSSDNLVDKLLSSFLGEEVELRWDAPVAAELERAVPDAVLADGPSADVQVTMLEIAAAAPPGTFFDYAPLHLVTSASLGQVGAAHPAGRMEAVRYRPNVVIETAAGVGAFQENDWVGGRLHVGPEAILSVLLPTPRCAVPTLPHGDLPADPEALRVPMRENFVPVPLEGFGSEPCVGVYAGVVQGGRVSPGDEVVLAR